MVSKLCLTLCDPKDCSPPASFIHGILQARILGWVVISLSRRSSREGTEPRSLKSPALQADSLPLSCLGSLTQVCTPHARKPTCLYYTEVCIMVTFDDGQMVMNIRNQMTLLTIPCQVPLSMGFSRQEYWGGWPCPHPGDRPDPGIKNATPVACALAGGFFR